MTMKELLLSICEKQRQRKATLENTTHTWARIAKKDSTLADDLGCAPSELETFLKEWIDDNPYNNII